MNHLSVEEVSARRAELAKMRDLMFRAEAKAKRIAKIKSKTYRRLKKKERARLAEKLGEGSDDDLDDEEARLKREVERARERATLRHKNTGKWAKAMRARGELDEDQRRDINEMLDRGEKLRRKIQGEGESDEESEDEGEDKKKREQLGEGEGKGPLRVRPVWKYSLSRFDGAINCTPTTMSAPTGLLRCLLHFLFAHLPAPKTYRI